MDELRISKITNLNFDKICKSCVGSKQTWMVRRQKLITITEKKLKKVYVDLWGPHNLPSLLGSTYIVILVCKKTRKTWVLYLRSKDKFVNVFQNWLPRVENESGCRMKTLRVDGRGEFISITLKIFCEKKGIALKYAAPYIHEENGLVERG